MKFIKLFFILFLFLYSLPALSAFYYNYGHFPQKAYIRNYDVDTARKYAFEKEPIQFIDMTPYKDFLIDGDYTEIMKLMKEDNLYKTLLKNNPFHTFLYKDDLDNIYAYSKYYLNNRNIIFTYSLSGELINIKISQQTSYPRVTYIYSNKGEIIEITLRPESGHYYRFKPNGDFIKYEIGSTIFTFIRELNINSTDPETTLKNISINISNNSDIIFSQGRNNINSTLLNNTSTKEDNNILNRIVFSQYYIWTVNHPKPLPEAPFYDVNTARNYVMLGEQPPQTIDMSEYKEYMIDKDRDEIIKEIINNGFTKKHDMHSNDFWVLGFYNFDLFTGYYAKQYIKSNIVFYYNIKGELQKIEIRPKETAFKVFIKKAPEFPLKSYFYSKDGNLMFINLIVNEHDCYLFKPNNEFYSLWSGYVEFDSNYYQKGLRGDILH